MTHQKAGKNGIAPGVARKICIRKLSDDGIDYTKIRGSAFAKATDGHSAEKCIIVINTQAQPV